MKTVKVLFVGICGYASRGVNALLDTTREDVKIEGLVEPYPERCRRLEEISSKNIPLYNTMDEFYAEHSADLAVINTPIQFHTEHILNALAHGSHVLCEKPLCADAKDIEHITQASRRAGKFVDIGYQWSHNEGILQLKTDILNGVYGKALSLKSITLWPREDIYFHRGCGWAGKLYDSEGRAVFDSVANNATAHHLHNIFFVCGTDMRSAMEPKCFDAVLMRTNPIETYDTCVLWGNLQNDVPFLFIASHAVEEEMGPICEFTFENGIVRLESFHTGMMNPHFIGLLTDGTKIDYGDPNDNQIRKLWLSIENAKHNAVGKECCPIEAAAVHTRVISELQNKFNVYPTRDALTIMRQEGNKVFTYAKGLDNALLSVFAGQEVELSEFCALHG